MVNSCEIFPDYMLERVWQVSCSCPQSGGGEFDPTKYYTKEQTQARIDSAKADVEADIQELSEEVASGQTDIQDEIDALETSKADKADVYGKQETDVKLAAKANLSDVYSKDDIDGLLSQKASTATTDALSAAVDSKQATLVSGVNIKTLNEESLLGSGNIEITGGTVDAYTKAETNALLAEKQDTSGMVNYATTATVATKADITALTQVNGVLTAHTADTVAHTTATEKNTWNTVTGKADATAVTAINQALTGHTANTEMHTSAAEKATWGTVTGKADTTALTAVNNALTAHTANTEIHTTSQDKTNWNGAATNATQALTQLNGYTITSMTKAQFDALTVKDTQTIYFVKD